MTPESLRGITQRQMLLRFALILGERGGGNAFLPSDLTSSEKEWFAAEAKRRDLSVFELKSGSKTKLSALVGGDAFFKLLKFEKEIRNDGERYFCANLITQKLRRWQSEANRAIDQPNIQLAMERMDGAGKSFMHEGTRYFPLSAVAPIIQAPRSTVLDWIKKGTKFKGEPLQSYHFAPANRYYISEESVERAANRFIRWPSQQPAGSVTLGETKERTGYVGLAPAARTVGVDHRTMWLWATHGKAPTAEPLDVIKCPATEQFYIRESDVRALKSFAPRPGLRRGPHPRASAKPG